MSFATRVRSRRGMGDLFDVLGGGSSGSGSLGAGAGTLAGGDSQIAIDARNLNALGYPTPITTDASDPDFVHAVSAFQSVEAPNAGPEDGKIGPTTRAWIAKKLGLGSGAAPSYTPPTPSPSTPSGAKKEESKLGLYLAIGAAAALGLFLFVKKKGPKK
jgi:hypothetical protein